MHCLSRVGAIGTSKRAGFRALLRQKFLFGVQEYSHFPQVESNLDPNHNDPGSTPDPKERRLRLTFLVVSRSKKFLNSNVALVSIVPLNSLFK